MAMEFLEDDSPGFSDQLRSKQGSDELMKEILYGQNSLLIAITLFVSMVLAIKLGYRVGQNRNISPSESYLAHVNSIQSSLLGVLALLLGFTFSLALQRFDSRSEAVVEEANAIGTAYLRAQLLPASIGNNVRTLFQRYIDLRVQAGAITLANEVDYQASIANENQVLDDLWSFARKAAVEDGRPVTSGLFIQSLNEAIDSHGRRIAALNRHVPEPVLIILFGTFLMTGGVVGYAAGITGHHLSEVTYILVALIVVIAFIIMDIDRPRRGLIKVDQTSLSDLKAAIDADQYSVTP